jgi:hypothetical protein
MASPATSPAQYRLFPIGSLLCRSSREAKVTDYYRLCGKRTPRGGMGPWQPRADPRASSPSLDDVRETRRPSGGGRDSRPTPGLRLALQYPARDSLVVVERPRHGHVRLDVGEAGARERAIRRHVECVGFTEESLDL